MSSRVLIERRKESFQVRTRAAQLAKTRPHPEHCSNGEENRYIHPQTGKQSLIASFTKGLPHNPRTGLIYNPDHYDNFVHAINTGDEGVIRTVELGPPAGSGFSSAIAKAVGNVKVRGWESMAAGLAYDLQGPDAEAVTMPPAPTLDSTELATEMTELYWMSLLRDIPFTQFNSHPLVQQAVSSINATSWVSNGKSASKITAEQLRRLRPVYDTKSVFRGGLNDINAVRGANQGPYISQFLLTGSNGRAGVFTPDQGYITYGASRIDQRVQYVQPEKDYMTSWQSWLDVQNGADLRGADKFVSGSDQEQFRFITTPRDLATYVHFDQLYQAYLDACIIMLSDGKKFKFDKGMPFIEDDSIDKQQGFALFGGPHILSLLTEVATRALKAVRFQKFITHRHLRPEAVGGLLERFHNTSSATQTALFAPTKPLYSALDKDMLKLVARHNKKQNTVEEVEGSGYFRQNDYSPSSNSSGETILLPMAFPEGSPMHPTYGAGHATIAGACVTILKAWFDTSVTFDTVYVPSTDGSKLVETDAGTKLTVEGELNKLAWNISIGRNWGGVHYFSDYIESLLLGEEVALGILEEQKGTYKETFKWTVPLFLGGTVQI